MDIAAPPARQRSPRMDHANLPRSGACEDSGPVWFSWDNLVLTLAQAACVILPAAGIPAWLQRFRTGAWALILPLNIAVVVFAIVLIPTTADVLTWVALLLVPAGCALALGWAARGARPWLAPLAA